jgi:hypothetical protein
LESGYKTWSAIAGIGAGLAHLARSDGLLLVGIALLVGVTRAMNPNLLRRAPGTGSGQNGVAQRSDDGGCKTKGGRIARFVATCAPFAIGYLVVTAPWFVRNLSVIGRPLSVSGTRSLWLTDYDDLYSYQKVLSLRTFLAWGWANILRSKLQGLWLNLQTLLVVDWMIALVPFGLVGVWRLRRHPFFLPAWLYGLALYLAMSLGFTLPGVRGAMLHSSVALLPFLFAASMDGLDALVSWVAARRRGWHRRQAQIVFSVGLVGIIAVLSAFLYLSKLPVFRGEHAYQPIAHWAQAELDPDERILINDPAAFYYYSGLECLSVPNGDVETLLAVARRYGARYVVLDKNTPSLLNDLYQRPESDGRFRLIRQFQDREGEQVNVYQIGE